MSATGWRPIQGEIDITVGFFFLQFCQAHVCPIQKQSRGKSFMEHFLKKINFSLKGKVVVIQILMSCIDSFLVACTRLYTLLCPSVGRLVSRLVGRSVGQSVGWSVGPNFTFLFVLFLLSHIKSIKWFWVKLDHFKSF